MPSAKASTTTASSSLASCATQSFGQNVVSRRNSVSTVIEACVASRLQAARSSAVVVIRVVIDKVAAPRASFHQLEPAEPAEFVSWPEPGRASGTAEALQAVTAGHTPAPRVRPNRPAPTMALLHVIGHGPLDGKPTASFQTMTSHGKSRRLTKNRRLGSMARSRTRKKTTMHRYRSHTCGALRADSIGQEGRLSGWCHRIRDHGGVLFIDLRDHYGLTQCVADPITPAYESVQKARSEWVIRV